MKNDGQTIAVPVPRVRPVAFDYLELLKPELTGLSVLTALCGFYLAGDSFSLISFFWLGLGTLCVGGGAGALNQYMERHFDALMKRTERRPLPSGRLRGPEVILYGAVLSITGLVVLAVATNLLTAALGAVTSVSYLFVYTPLKRSTPFATLVGAIPGALPPVMGWTAASGRVSIGAISLFAILFLWQMPHFLSLAWMYRKDYSRAGYRMLSVSDPAAARTGTQILCYCIALIPASVSTTLLGLTGNMYLAGSLMLGTVFLLFAVLFARSSGSSDALALAKVNQHARRMFAASLLYLPALMFLMTIDKR